MQTFFIVIKTRKFDWNIRNLNKDIILLSKNEKCDSRDQKACWDREGIEGAQSWIDKRHVCSPLGCV
jgi:hypothetical protein